MQKGKDSLMMSGSQGLQGFFPCILPGLFLPIPGIQDSLGVAQTGLWVSPPWRETVKCYSPAQPCVPVASPHPSVSTAVLEPQIMPISPRMYPNQTPYTLGSSSSVGPEDFAPVCPQLLPLATATASTGPLGAPSAGSPSSVHGDTFVSNLLGCNLNEPKGKN